MTVPASHRPLLRQGPGDRDGSIEWGAAVSVGKEAGIFPSPFVPPLRPRSVACTGFPDMFVASVCRSMADKDKIFVSRPPRVPPERVAFHRIALVRRAL